MEAFADFYSLAAHQNSYTAAIIVSVIVILISSLIYYLRRSDTRRSVIIAGVCNSGKSLLHYQLTRGQFVETYTSIKPNTENYKTAERNTSLALVDLPGHERLRHEYLDKYKDTARAVIYVIDSSTIQKELKDVSQYLFMLLTDKVIHQSVKHVLILCNKQDFPLAKSAKAIQNMLEKEISLLRVTQSASLDTTTGAKSHAIFLGKREMDFEFKDIKANVEFCECVAKDSNEQGPQLKPVEQWLDRIG